MPTESKDFSAGHLQPESYGGELKLKAAPPPARELTYGEKAVGLTFNPGGHPQVNSIKKLSADLIDEIHSQRLGLPGQERHPCKWDQFTEAIRRIQEGQMWAVKAATWQY